MKIIKKLIALSLITSFSLANVFATGTPVFDVSNLMNGVSQLYAMYDDVNAAIENVTAQYQQLKAQYDSVKNIDWTNWEDNFTEDKWSSEGGVKGAWQNIGNFRNNVTNAVSAINDNLNILQDMKDSLVNKPTYVMGKPYTVGGLLGIGNYGENNLLGLPLDALDYAKEKGEAAMAGWLGNLTYEDKENIMQKWGMSPENYFWLKLAEEQVNGVVEKIICDTEEDSLNSKVKKCTENANTILELSSETGDSFVAQAQATQLAVINVGRDINNFQNTMGRWASYTTKKDLADKIKEQAEQRREADKEKRAALDYNAKFKRPAFF